jgi:hypothetical protein
MEPWQQQIYRSRNTQKKETKKQTPRGIAQANA